AEAARVTLGNDYISTAVFLSVTSFFNALSLSRPLSNSLETSLCSLAFAYYPWDARPDISPHVMFNRSKLRRTIAFSALACMMRPTNAVVWIFLYAKLVLAFRRYPSLLFAFFKDTAIVALGALGALFAVDTLYYGKPTFTPYNFLVTNLSSVSLFYGGSPWHYYLTQGLPILCTTALPFVLHGIYTTFLARNTPKKNLALQRMVSTIVWAVGIYSLAGHKEWRFIHPLLPLFYLFAAKSLVDLHGTSKVRGAKLKTRPKREKSNSTWVDFPIRKWHFALLLSMMPVTVYVVLFYCSGPISVMSYIRTLPISSSEKTFTDTVGLLTPCHSLPGHAYIHREALALPGRVWALGCEPPLGGQNLTTYQDQTDIFFADPKEYLRAHFPHVVNTDFPPSLFPTSRPGQSGLQPWKHEWPKHLILFGDLLRDELGVRDVLEGKGYAEVRKFGREWEGEGKRKGAVRVWRWQG
ncbi:GPI mannosyltransferase 3, partial [Coprinopsis sp. MPI-PUGE-AT-0042]